MDNPDNTVARAFQAIDGLEPRTQNLTNLVASLGPWERRHIRLQLGSRDGLAGFEDLPVDLVCLLARHLHLEDVLACAAVCTRTRATWTDRTAVATITLHFFPALRPPFTFAAFRAACRKYLRRRAGIFTARMEQPLPDVGSSTLKDEAEDSRVVRRFDPGLHPYGRHPPGWDETLIPKPAGYGKGNIVWFVLPRFFVVDNLYTRERKVVYIPGAFCPKGNAVAGESLVVIRNQSQDRLLVYNLETNTLSQFRSPSHVSSTALRGRRIFLSLEGPQVCVLDHDGSRLLTTYHFNPAKDLKGEYPHFNLSPGAPVICPHPHLPDRFFVVLDGSRNSPCPEGPATHYLIAREYEGASLVSAQELQLQNPYSGGEFVPAWEATALDDQGTYYAGCWALPWGTRSAEPPPRPLRGLPIYCFNVMTKRFSVQRHLYPRHTDDVWWMNRSKVGNPWHQQVLVPWVDRPGVLGFSRHNADGADFMLSRVAGPGPAGARLAAEGWDMEQAGWVMEQEGLEEHTVDLCWMYHDEDFTVLVWDETRCFHVWSFVESEQGTSAATRPRALVRRSM